MQAYTTLLQSYHDLNSSSIITLDSEPSPLEFMRHVSRNRPFVIRDAARDWPAVQKWNANYLKQKMVGQTVSIALTPLGNADAPLERQPGEYIFVQPCEVQQEFPAFLDGLEKTSRSESKGPEPVAYAQSQNDNLHHEYLPLFADVMPEIEWVRIALQQANPEAINLWMGTERSVTALHKDNYENIYVQVIGQKHFVLLPPLEGPCVNEQVMSQGVYQIKDEDGRMVWDIVELHEAEAIPVAVWDPDMPDQRVSRYSHLSRPLRVTLKPGDMLYLPSMWYHKVTQTCGQEGICVAVNYWYDMDFEGSFHAASSFIREVMLEVDQK